MFPRIAVILGVLIAQASEARAAAGSPADAIQPNSVWEDGQGVTLTILERNGGTFRARFHSGKADREVTGTVKDDTISWLAKDVRAISGGPGGDNFGTITDGKIDFTWRDAKGGSAEFSLMRGFEDRTFHGPDGKTLPYKLHVPVGGGDPARIVAAKNVPIWATHGDRDKVVPVERSRELIAALTAAGGHPKYSEYRGLGHGDGIDHACKKSDLVAWLLHQKRSTR
jgi:pimeloyl-ACP methyl ester carboxylesterase